LYCNSDSKFRIDLYDFNKDNKKYKLSSQILALQTIDLSENKANFCPKGKIFKNKTQRPHFVNKISVSFDLKHFGISIYIWKSPPLMQYAVPFFPSTTSVPMYQVYEKCWFVLHFEKPFSPLLWSTAFL